MARRVLRGSLEFSYAALARRDEPTHKPRGEIFVKGNTQAKRNQENKAEEKMLF
jgi:hypothetical protein